MVAKDDKDGENVDMGTKDGTELGVDYQRAGMVRQLLAERANAVAYGQTDRVEAVDKQLTELGYTGDPAVAPPGKGGDAPAGRAARSDKTLTTEAPAAGEAAPQRRMGATRP